MAVVERTTIFPLPPRGAAGRITRRVKNFLEADTWQRSTPTTLIVACSGGADSLILAASLAYLAPQRNYRLLAVTIDHSWRAESAQEAKNVARQLEQWGYEKTEIVRVNPVGSSPEGAAREARYLAFKQVAEKYGIPGENSFIVLGHTRDDQAESLLLGLARGSGLASLKAMAEQRGAFLRPLLDIPRSDTIQACKDLGLEYVDDPTNYPTGAVRTASGNPLPRTVLRHEIIPQLSQALGQDIRINLAKTAQQMQLDQEALLQWVENLWRSRASEVSGLEMAQKGLVPQRLFPEESEEENDSQYANNIRSALQINVAQIAEVPVAIRMRLWRKAVLSRGAVNLKQAQLLLVDDLAIKCTHNGPIDFGAGVKVYRPSGMKILCIYQQNT